MWKKYSDWCSQLGEEPLPVTEDKAMAYVVALTRDRLRVASVKHHLAGMRMAQIKAGMAAPDWGAMARLTQLRKGLARLEAVGEKDKLRGEPVKWHHMRAMQAAWKPEGRKGAMLWAAACMCFFGCMRAGEALTPEGVEFDGKAHLSWEDVQLEDAPSPKWIRVRIKESKMDRLRVGAFVILQRTDLDICLVKAVLEFMAARAAVLPGPERSGPHLAGLRGRSKEGSGGEGYAGRWDLRPQLPNRGGYGSSQERSNRRGGEGPWEVEKQRIQGLYQARRGRASSLCQEVDQGGQSGEAQPKANQSL